MVHTIPFKEKINSMKKEVNNLLAVSIMLLPAAYLAAIWNSLPQQVPMHFNLKMEPDRYGDKSELWLATGVMILVSIGVYFLLRNIQKLDPKRRNAEQASVFHKLAFGIAFFVTALNFLIITSVKGIHSVQQYWVHLIGLLFAFLGNYMVNIKPNYFAGFRLPWTLADDNNWRKTHQLGGKLWFGGGILIAVVCLFLPVNVAFIFFISIVVIITVIPVVYSYRIFKSQV